LQDILTANDPDSLVLDFDRVHYRADVALPGVGIAVVELLGHQVRKCIDLLGIYSRGGAALGARAVESGLGTFPFRLQGDGALAQNVIDLDDAIFDRTIVPPQAIVEGCMNGHPLRIATTTAMEDCVITSITKDAMIAAIHDEPKFSELFMTYLLTRNSRIEEDLIDQLFNSSERRLARLLLLLAKFGKEGSPQPISPNISQEILADIIGTTRSRVSHFMISFHRDLVTNRAASSEG
jgi:CRP-like cAMP-binding protein